MGDPNDLTSLRSLEVLGEVLLQFADADVSHVHTIACECVHIEDVVEAGARLLSPGPALGQRVMDVASRLDVTGPRVFDLQIAVTALDHGAVELWSHDRRFVTPPGLRLVDPLAS